MVIPLVFLLLVVTTGVVIGVTVVVCCRSLDRAARSQRLVDPSWEIDQRLRSGLSEMLRVLREEQR